MGSMKAYQSTHRVAPTQVEPAPAMSTHNKRGAMLLPWQAARVSEYIDRHIADPIRVCDLSALVCRGRAHFSRLFKKHFGLSPYAYVLRRRIELASLLIVESNTALSQIALKCGFADQAHFCRRFRDHTGTTPAAWRRAEISRSGLLPSLHTIRYTEGVSSP